MLLQCERASCNSYVTETSLTLTAMNAQLEHAVENTQMLHTEMRKGLQTNTNFDPDQFCKSATPTAVCLLV